LERRVQQRIVVDALATASWIGWLLVVGAGVFTIIWLRTVLDLGLSGPGRLAAHDGQALGMLGWTLLSNLVPRMQPPLLVAKIDSAGNRVLQLMSQDLPTRSDAFLNAFGLGAVSLGVVAFAAFSITKDLLAPGDRPLGFLAGFGSMAVVVGPLLLLITAVRWLAPKLQGPGIAERTAV